MKIALEIPDEIWDVIQQLGYNISYIMDKDQRDRDIINVAFSDAEIIDDTLLTETTNERIMIEISDEKYNSIKDLEDGVTDYQTTLMLYRAVKDAVRLDGNVLCLVR